MKKIYNKLVRDKIPAIIEAYGKKANYRVLSKEERLAALEEKIKEELAEYMDAKTEADKIEELADICEVLSALVEYFGVRSVIDRAFEKYGERGGFSRGVFLESVEVDE